ncbi:MAG TPA: hypothetical protein VIS07_02700 [Candidatus Binatia bacterium]
MSYQRLGGVGRIVLLAVAALAGVAEAQAQRGVQVVPSGDAMEARGFDGQHIYVLPSLDLVVVGHGRYVKDPGPPIADPSLFERYPSVGLVPGRGTTPPDPWDTRHFLGSIVDSIVK